MAEYISREATIEKLNKLCDRVCQYSKAQRKYMRGACPLGDAFTVIEDDIPAADAIEELSNIREEQKAQIILMAAEIEEQKPRWIPVTERLPEEGEFVLVYGDLYPNKHDGGVIAVSKRMDWNYWQGFGRERDITHWMPLPQPPKEE